VHAIRWRISFSRKAPREERVLAIKMRHEHFQHLLSLASVTHSNGGPLSQEDRRKPVRVQWDPERLTVLQDPFHRNIRIGISSQISMKWINNWIVDIEDVTDEARVSKKAVDAGHFGLKELVERGLFPDERVYEVDERLRETLQIN
jgi:hypothetical protein